MTTTEAEADDDEKTPFVIGAAADAGDMDMSRSSDRSIPSEAIFSRKAACGCLLSFVVY